MGDTDLASLASRQGALVTRAQSRDQLSRRQLDSRLGTRRLEVVRRSVYRFAGAAPDRFDDLRAACMAAGPTAVASHRAAADVWDMATVVSLGPEITVPWPMWPRLPGVKGHTTRYLPESHCTERHGVPVTTPARTLVDLSACLGSELLGSVVDSCLRRRLTSLDEIRSAYQMVARPGRRHSRAIREVLEGRQPGWRPGDSAAELDLAAIVVAAGFPRPVQQHQVVLDGTVYLLDWAYPELLVGIEYDGWEHHAARGSFDHDARRATAFAVAGWSLLRFTSASPASAVVASVSAARARGVRAKTTCDV